MEGQGYLLNKITMPTYIGTNFSYDSKDFLDERIGKARDKQDLKNWNIRVPEGFEICLDGIWYYYDSNKEVEETGHWIPRIGDEDTLIDPNNQSASLKSVTDLRGDLNNVSDSVEELNKFANPASFKSLVGGSLFTTQSALDTDLNYKTEQISKQQEYLRELDFDEDGVLTDADITGWRNLYNSARPDIPLLSTSKSSTYSIEVGTKIIPSIEWSVIQPSITWSLSGSSVVWSIVKGTDTNYVTPKKINVSGSTNGILTGNKWNSTEILTSITRVSKTYTVSCIMEDGQQFSGSVIFRFSLKNYGGSSSIALWNKSSLTMTDVAGFTSRFTENGAFTKTNFNCSGGKYPYILIPTDLYNSSLKTFMNDNLNSDFVIKDVTLINSLGLSIRYKMLRTGYIQTGSAIGIEIK